MSFAQDRLAAVAQAIANVRYPIAVDPLAQESDFEEARRFLAALDTALRFPLYALARQRARRGRPAVPLLEIEEEILRIAAGTRSANK